MRTRVGLEVKVHNNQVQTAIKALSKKLMKEGFLKELKRKRYYEKPSERRKRKDKEARRRRLKAENMGF